MEHERTRQAWFPFQGGLLLTDADNLMEWLDATVAEAMREATRRYLR